MFKKIEQRSGLMKKNTKFIWMYGAILFSFALILILFAGLTQSNYQKELNKEQKETAGIKQSLSALSKENKKLETALSELEKENQKLKEETTQLAMESEMAISAYGGDKEVTHTLIEAYTLLASGQKEKATETVKGLNVYLMTQAQKQVYNTIIGE